MQCTAASNMNLFEKNKRKKLYSFRAEGKTIGKSDMK
jgi:hypothetical protein